MTFSRFILALCASTALSTPIFAQTGGVFSSPELASFEFGMLCYYSNANPNVPLTPAEIQAIAETTASYDDVRADGSLVVPALPNTVFGVLSSFPSGQSHNVTSIINHTTPTGVRNEDYYDFTIGDIAEIDGWRMDVIDETSLGTYVFTAKRGADLIYEITFTVVPPEQFTGTTPPCVNL